MIIRTLGFNPMKVTVDSVEVPVENHRYNDVNGISQTIYYVVVNGEKIAIKYQAELSELLMDKSMDETLAKVEEERKCKYESLKNKV